MTDNWGGQRDFNQKEQATLQHLKFEIAPEDLVIGQQYRLKLPLGTYTTTYIGRAEAGNLVGAYLFGDSEDNIPQFGIKADYVRVSVFPIRH
jgi:hypothetical protein